MPETAVPPASSSSSPLAIQAEKLGKKYVLYSGAGGRLIEGLSGGLFKKGKDFWALRDFSFAVEKGEAVGVIGQNGSGKSTLLKLLAGLTTPSEGRVEVNGRIGSLIELGTGFNPEFSGRANARLSATLLGISPDEFEEKFPAIEKFAAIGDFIDRPVKTYSSGMQVRLAFSVAIAVEPEILLIDEALAVGDLLFIQKCMRRLKEIRDKGVTLVMVTHDLAAVKNFCTRAYLLDGGQVLARGPTAEVVDEYNALVQKRTLEGTDREIISVNVAVDGGTAKQRHGSFEAIITRLEITSADGSPAAALIAGARGRVRVAVAFLEEVENPVVGILIRDRLTNPIFGTNSGLHHLKPGRFLPGESLEADFEMDFELGAGEYSVTVAVHTEIATFDKVFDWADDMLAFKVLPTEPGFIGVARLRPALTLRHAGGGAGASGEAAFAELFKEAPASIDLDHEPHRRYLVRGFYPLERDPEGPFRWSQPEVTFVLAPAGGKLELFALCIPPEGGELRVALRVGARDLAPLIVSTAGWQPLTFDLPADLAPGPQRFQLKISPPFEPPGDPRQLGIALRRLGTPAPAETADKETNSALKTRKEEI